MDKPMSDIETLLAKYGGAVPRYTSYPTAPHFDSGVDGRAVSGWLEVLGSERQPQPVSLYVHVPFCAQLCYYCGCNMQVVRRRPALERYVSALTREIEMVAGRIGRRLEVSHLHWGGGTPNALAGDDFMEIMDVLARYFDIPATAEIAVEIDPRSLKADYAKAMAAGGVSRVSFGVQDFDPKVQAEINRVQPFEQVKQAADLVRDAGIHHLNLDLMYGLPRQTTAHVARSANLAADLDPGRIALFGYAHVPWMKKHQALMDASRLPDVHARFEQAQTAADVLVGRGFTRVGLDHFARRDDELAEALDEGRLRRNFQGYTTDQAETLLAFGASAISKLPTGFSQNIVATTEYLGAIEADTLPVHRGVAVDGEDRLRSRIIEKLMCDMDADLSDLAGDAASGHFIDELSALKDLAKDGVVLVDGTRVTIPEDARPLMRSVCAVFDQYLAKGKARHSQAV